MGVCEHTPLEPAWIGRFRQDSSGTRVNWAFAARHPENPYSTRDSIRASSLLHRCRYLPALHVKRGSSSGSGGVQQAERLWRPNVHGRAGFSETLIKRNVVIPPSANGCCRIVVAVMDPLLIENIIDAEVQRKILVEEAHAAIYRLPAAKQVDDGKRLVDVAVFPAANFTDIDVALRLEPVG